MGGEWCFVYKPETNEIPLPLDKYKASLVAIRNAHRHKFRNCAEFRASWCSGNEPAANGGDNVFATFTYNCKWDTCRHNRENGETLGKYGYGNSTAAWKLYWDPAVAPKDAFDEIWSDVYARCAPGDFIINSVSVQKMLAKEYPKHFQLYLGDDVSGCGPGCDQYWGIVPQHKTAKNPNYDASDDSGL